MKKITETVVTRKNLEALYSVFSWTMLLGVSLGADMACTPFFKGVYFTNAVVMYLLIPIFSLLSLAKCRWSIKVAIAKLIAVNGSKAEKFWTLYNTIPFFLIIPAIIGSESVKIAIQFLLVPLIVFPLLIGIAKFGKNY